MDVTVFISVLFALQILCFVMGRMASKDLKNQDDYFLAGRGVRFFPLLMTLVATQIGGGLVVGASEEAYKFGWYVLLYPMGACLGMVLLALGIGKKMSQFKVSTIAQLFEVVYGSVKLKKLASLLSIVSLFLIVVAQVIASKKFMVSVGVDQDIIFLAFWGIVILYTVAGGLKAVVATDIIQAIFFIGVFIACFAFSAYSNPKPFSEVINIGFGSNFVLDEAKWCGWLLMPLLFMVIEQDMGQRCFAAKSGKVVSWASGGAALCVLLVCTVPVYYGILAKSMGLHIPTGSSVLMSVVQASTGPVMAALIGCAILAAIISTADSLLNAISSNVAQDFDLSIVKKIKSVKVAQWTTGGIAILAICGSFYFTNVVDLMISSYELSVSCLFVPVFAALFIRKGFVLSASLAIALGASGFVMFRILGVPVPMGIPAEVASLILSSCGYALGEIVKAIQTQDIVETVP